LTSTRNWNSDSRRKCNSKTSFKIENGIWFNSNFFIVFVDVF
jgi:hypothetical protein